MSDWRCVRRGLVGVVREISVQIDCDHKFTEASVLIDAETDDGKKVRLFTRRERGLRVRGQSHTKKTDLVRPFACLIGAPIYFDEKELTSSGVVMHFPTLPTTEALHGPIEEIQRMMFVDKIYVTRALR